VHKIKSVFETAFLGFSNYFALLLGGLNISLAGIFPVNRGRLNYKQTLRSSLKICRGHSEMGLYYKEWYMPSMWSHLAEVNNPLLKYIRTLASFDKAVFVRMHIFY